MMPRLLLDVLACLTVLLEPGHVKRVIDADTPAMWDADDIRGELRVRVLGVNAPERGQPGFDAANAFATEWLAKGPFFMKACRYDSFGRLLGILYRGADTLAIALIHNGHGVPYVP